mmetsp:Transcript_8568/g.24056  ORF Transcript_8568/g.24056 Transcript_8568/m.24056 type:complete len:278 (-) Transcript_8568:1006-1839(-)
MASWNRGSGGGPRATSSGRRGRPATAREGCPSAPRPPGRRAWTPATPAPSRRVAAAWVAVKDVHRHRLHPGPQEHPRHRARGPGSHHGKSWACSSRGGRASHTRPPRRWCQESECRPPGLRTSAAGAGRPARLCGSPAAEARRRRQVLRPTPVHLLPECLRPPRPPRPRGPELQHRPCRRSPGPIQVWSCFPLLQCVRLPPAGRRRAGPGGPLGCEPSSCGRPGLPPSPPSGRGCRGPPASARPRRGPPPPRWAGSKGVRAACQRARVLDTGPGRRR